MRELICDREFIINVDGEDRRVVVEWMKPVRWKGDWRCEWEVLWPHKNLEPGYSVGVDSTQALLLAMKRVQSTLKYEATNARWLDSDELGLPRLDE